VQSAESRPSDREHTHHVVTLSRAGLQVVAGRSIGVASCRQNWRRRKAAVVALRSVTPWAGSPRHGSLTWRDRANAF